MTSSTHQDRLARAAGTASAAAEFSYRSQARSLSTPAVGARVAAAAILPISTMRAAALGCEALTSPRTGPGFAIIGAVRPGATGTVTARVDRGFNGIDAVVRFDDGTFRQCAAGDLRPVR